VDGKQNRVSHLLRRGSVGALLALIAGASIVASPALASRSSAAARGPVDNGTLTMVTDGSAADLDGASDELASSANIALNIQETLLTFQGSSITKYRPVLATSWKSQNGGKVWIVNLRHNVKFHTGRTMTSADVVYSLQRTILAKQVNAYLLSRFFSHVQTQITAVNKYTVKFTLDKPSPFFLASLADEYVCAIMDSTALKAHAKKGDYGAAWAQTADIGTGPYMLKSWQHSQQETLTRFKDYWGGWNGPHFSTIIVKTVPESSTRRELVEKGQADLTFQLTPQDYAAMQKEKGIKLVAPYATEVDYAVMTQAGPLKSPYARQAMSYAMDYNALLASALKGYGRRAYGPIPQTLLGFHKGFVYNTNLQKAKQLFLKGGDKPGTTFTYEYAPGPVNEITGRILQAQLAQIGYTLKLQQVDEATFNGIFYGSEPASKRPNIMPFGWWPDYNDPYDMANSLVNSQLAAPNGPNAGMYHDTKVDSVLKKMANETGSTLLKDSATLQNLTSQVDPPALWLDEPAQVTVMRSNLKGLVANPLFIQVYDFYALHH
jgi:peptide/nickel transport system substrate-binding protein